MTGKQAVKDIRILVEATEKRYLRNKAPYHVYGYALAVRAGLDVAALRNLIAWAMDPYVDVSDRALQAANRLELALNYIEAHHEEIKRLLAA